MWSCRQLTTFHVVVQVDCEVAHNTLSLREIFKGKMHSLRSPLKTSLSACSHSASEKGNCQNRHYPFSLTPFYRLTVTARLSSAWSTYPLRPQGGTSSPRNCLDVIATISATVKGKSGTADRSLVEDKERPLTVSANPNTNPQGSGFTRPDPLPNGEWLMGQGTSPLWGLGQRPKVLKTQRKKPYIEYKRSNFFKKVSIYKGLSVFCILVFLE